MLGKVWQSVLECWAGERRCGDVRKCWGRCGKVCWDEKEMGVWRSVGRGVRKYVGAGVEKCFGVWGKVKRSV